MCICLNNELKSIEWTQLNLIYGKVFTWKNDIIFYFIVSSYIFIKYSLIVTILVHLQEKYL